MPGRNAAARQSGTGTTGKRANDRRNSRLVDETEYTGGKRLPKTIEAQCHTVTEQLQNSFDARIVLTMMMRCHVNKLAPPWSESAHCQSEIL